MWRSKHGNARQDSWSHTRGNYIALAKFNWLVFMKHNLQIIKCFLSPVSLSDNFLLVGTVFIIIKKVMIIKSPNLKVPIGTSILHV